MRHMFYGPFGTQNSMLTLIFKFGHTKGQFQVKIGQCTSNLKIQNFLTKTFISCPVVLSQDFKNASYFYVLLVCHAQHDPDGGCNHTNWAGMLLAHWTGWKLTYGDVNIMDDTASVLEHRQT